MKPLEPGVGDVFATADDQRFQPPQASEVAQVIVRQARRAEVHPFEPAQRLELPQLRLPNMDLVEVYVGDVNEEVLS